MQSQVAIIGAGPIGLLIGNLLGAKGIDTIIIEKNDSIDSKSRAIGVTPPSLKILDSLNLQEEFVKKGVKIQDVKVFGKNQRDLGGLNFYNIPAKTDFILSIPQYETEKILLNNLKKFPNVEIVFDTEVTDICHYDNFSELTIRKNNTDDSKITATVVCSCDGFRSSVREKSGLRFKGKKYSDTFLMGDFIDKTGWGSQARLFFTPTGSVESFPLPNGKRRWVVLTEEFLNEPSPDQIIDKIKERAKVKLEKEDNINLSPFKVYRYSISRFYDKNIIFLGDAAHTISPIGGQGMNSGFGDAEFAAMVVEKTLQNGMDIKLFQFYDFCRRKAAESAALRAQLSMGVGTVRGSVFSGIRNLILKLVLNSPFKKVLPNHYAMLTIPFNSLDLEKTKKCLKKITS